MREIEFVSDALSKLKNGYWNNHPVIIPSPEKGWTENIFGQDALKWLLTEARIPENCFRIVDNGKLQPHRPYSRPIIVGERPTSYVLDGTKAAQALSTGSSLILSALEEFWSPINTLCKSLGKVLGTRVSSFAVVTPPGASGFVPHIDRTEQLVIQCQGNKEWKVYDIFSRGKQGVEVRLEDIGNPVLASNITEGQMLYLPQGAPHAAHTTDGISAHITLTFEPVTIGNWVEKALSEIIQQDDSFLTSLPPFYYEDPDIHIEKLKLKCMDILRKLEEKSVEIATNDMNVAVKKADNLKTLIKTK